MLKIVKSKLMGFLSIFKDSNDLNEKTIVGFISFIVMIIFAISDITLGLMEKDFIINSTIYNSFVITTLGSFGIAEVGKIFIKKETKSTPEEVVEIEEEVEID